MRYTSVRTQVRRAMQPLTRQGAVIVPSRHLRGNTRVPTGKSDDTTKKRFFGLKTTILTICWGGSLELEDHCRIRYERAFYGDTSRYYMYPSGYLCMKRAQGSFANGGTVNACVGFAHVCRIIQAAHLSTSLISSLSP